MNIIFTSIIATILMVLLLICCVKSFLKRTYMSSMFGITLIFSMVALSCFYTNCYSNEEQVMIFANCYEHIATIWGLFFLSKFIHRLIDGRGVPAFDIVMYILLSIDSIAFIINPFTELVYSPAFRTSDFGTVALVSAKTWYIVHEACSVVYVFGMLLLLIVGIIKTSRYYIMGYVINLINLALIFAVYFYFMNSRSLPADYSKPIFAIGILLAYLTNFTFSRFFVHLFVQNYIGEKISEAMFSYDKDGKLLKKNTKAWELLPDEIADDLESMRKYMGNIEDKGVYTFKKDDTYYEVNFEHLLDKKGLFIGAVFLFHDVTARELQLEQAYHAAHYDQLTECLNRLGFFEESRAFLKEHKDDRKYAIMVSGIVNFKGINGLYGSAIGDRILKEIAAILNTFKAEFPMVYGRTAEGKFSCLVPANKVEEIAIRLGTFPLYLSDDEEMYVDMCHGYVELDQPRTSFEEYNEMGLMALSACKKKARGFLKYTTDMADDLQKQQLLIEATHDAIETNQFYIELQPQIDLKNNCVTGAEALVRWEHPVLGRVSPVDFIPLFEENGYITKLDHFVWEEAAKTLSKLKDAGLYNGSISVNVSQVDIMNTDVAADIEYITRKYGVDPHKFHVEITESACVENRDILIRTMNALRERGFMIEIDDFGSGYSSLNALIKLPFDIVKLDMVFMREHRPGEKSDVVIKSIAKMIHALNSEIVVEGTEFESNVATSREIEADIAQGYYFSKPLSIQKFVEYSQNFNKN